ncbi:hypothetical protein BYT27DRAFT_7183243 [Phlegmacium glaucopus]|nr:hypothetical protein BYT27DRAFT_7183243 [Phlegmacium glaucopus]
MILGLKCVEGEVPFTELHNFYKYILSSVQNFGVTSQQVLGLLLYPELTVPIVDIFKVYESPFCCFHYRIDESDYPI